MSKRTKIILAILVAIVLVVMVVVSLTKSSGDAIEVSVATVEQGDITRTVSGSGRVQPEMDVDMSARISGEITHIHVEEGERVEKGELLVELDRQRYEAATDEARSQLLAARAEYKKAKADYQRVKDLYSQELTSKADLDAVEAAMMSAESNVQRMQAHLKQASDDLEKTRLLSPLSGVVVKLYKEEGEIAVGSQFQADPVLNVADLTMMEVLTEIDENDVVYVDIDEPATIEVDAIPDTTFSGVVSEIAHMATTRGMGTQEQVTNFEVKIAITSDVSRLRPGMSATVDIDTETHSETLYIPIQCVTARELKADSTQVADSADNPKDRSQSKKMEEVVFVVKDNQVQQIPVETGISDDTHIEIVSGLETDQTVVSGSYRALSKELEDGSEVTIKKDVGYRQEE